MTDIQQLVAAILTAQDVAWCDQCGTYKRIDEHIEHVAEVLVSELASWDFLMEVLDRNYPASVFPTLPDDENRDPGPRIVSLIRQIDQIRKGEQ
jgi:hypothetical protein